MVKKILNERETRKNILEIGRFLKCEQEILKIFHKYDMLLKNCSNPIEREAIALAGNEEVHFLLNSTPGYVMVGKNKIGKE